MLHERKYVLTIAGFDPSGGAGLTADIKTFEQHKVYGVSVCTAITLQTENEFVSLQWQSIEDVLKAIDTMLKSYPVQFVKTGIMPSFGYLNKIVSHLNKNYREIKIIVDPIIKSSSGFDFSSAPDSSLIAETLSEIFLITPNVDEAIALSGKNNSNEAAIELTKYCNVLLKGGHSQENTGTDVLYSGNKITEFKPVQKNIFPKHGSGCILSAAIASNLTLGLSLEDACRAAKVYTEKKLLSNPSLLAYHYV